MIFSSDQAGPVFCDWLDVTCSPDNSFIDDLEAFSDLQAWPLTFRDEDQLRSVREVSDISGSGSLAFDRNPRFHRASFSGGAMRVVRDSGCINDVLCLLSSVPHTVTRLDAAADFDLDFPPVLKALDRQFPSGRVSLTRKSLPVKKVLQVRESDGVETGTYYVGHRSRADVTLRVYDKQAELLDRRGVHSGPRTRLELTFRKRVGCTVGDVAMPTSLFYQYACPTLVADRPDGVRTPWEPSDDFQWRSGSKPDLSMPLPLLRRRMESSPEFDRLCELLSAEGRAGYDVACDMLLSRINAHRKEAGLDPVVLRPVPPKQPSPSGSVSRGNKKLYGPDGYIRDV